MKQSHVWMAAALLLLAAPSIQAGLINSASDPRLQNTPVVTFEHVPQGQYTKLIANGVTFSTPPGQAMFVTNVYSGLYNNTGNSLQNEAGANAFTTLTLSFAKPINAFGFNWGAADSPWELMAYNSNGTLVAAKLPVDGSSNSGNFYGLTGPGITTVTLVDHGAPDYIILDNLRYSPKHTPEPTSLTLLSLGAVGLAGYAWRRRRKMASIA